MFDVNNKLKIMLFTKNKSSLKQALLCPATSSRKQVSIPYAHPLVPCSRYNSICLQGDKGIVLFYVLGASEQLQTVRGPIVLVIQWIQLCRLPSRTFIYLFNSFIGGLYRPGCKWSYSFLDAHSEFFFIGITYR
jgi:hypothetical protein